MRIYSCLPGSYCSLLQASSVSYTAGLAAEREPGPFPAAAVPSPCSLASETTLLALCLSLQRGLARASAQGVCFCLGYVITPSLLQRFTHAPHRSRIRVSNIPATNTLCIASSAKERCAFGWSICNRHITEFIFQNVRFRANNRWAASSFVDFRNASPLVLWCQLMMSMQCSLIHLTHIWTLVEVILKTSPLVYYSSGVTGHRTFREKRSMAAKSNSPSLPSLLSFSLLFLHLASTESDVAVTDGGKSSLLLLKIMHQDCKIAFQIIPGLFMLTLLDL